MEDEDKIKITKLIRRETGCGLMTAMNGFEKLLEALKVQPIIMDNPPKLNITWQRNDNMTKEDKEFDELMILEDKIFDFKEAKKEYEYHYKRIKEILEMYPQLINTE